VPGPNPCSSRSVSSLGWTALPRGRNVVYPPMPMTGLFRLTRQLIYVVVALTLTAYCLVAPRFKEARFRRVYGAVVDAYAAGVPYWLPWPRKQP
jgi:methanethiol S-methyltransferase